MAGSFQFDMDLDGRKLIGESELQMGGGNFIANFDTTAHLNWVTHFHGKANEHVDAMSIGPNNTIVFTGYFRDLDAGCGRLRSKHFDDILLGTLSADGRCVWTRGYGSTDNDSGNALAVDRLGNMTVFGSFKSGTNFGGGPLTTIGYAGLFAASFTSDGKHRWSRSLWGHPLVNPKAAAVDEAGQVYVTLWFQDTIDIGDGPRKSQGKSDILLAALSPDGRLQWSLSVGGAESDYANGLYVDPHTGDILLAGSFQQSVDIGGDHLTSAGGADAFVARFDKGGKVKWARSLGSPEHDGLQHLALDAAGNIYALGYHTAPLTYGESHLQHLGRSDLLLVSMGPDGSPRWAMSLGGPQYDASTGVLVEPSGRILVAGSFHTQATFGPVHLTSAGGMDMFVAALRP